MKPSMRFVDREGMECTLEESKRWITYDETGAKVDKYIEVEQIRRKYPDARSELVTDINDEILNQYGEEYLRWTQGLGPSRGTPLSALPEMDAGTEMKLTREGVHSLEELAYANPMLRARIGINGGELIHKAKSFLMEEEKERQKKEAIAQDEEKQSMKEMLEKQAQKIAELEAKLTPKKKAE